MANGILLRACRLALLPALVAAMAGCDSTTQLSPGDALLAQGRTAEALRLLQAEAAQAPGDTRILISLATAQVRLKRFDDAEATMLRAVAVAPRSPKVRQNLALVYLWRKDLDKALDTFHQVLELQDTYPETNYYIGLIHEMRGDDETAVEYYVRDVNNGPSRAWLQLDRYKQRQRAAGLTSRAPSSESVWVFAAVCLVLAAGVYALRHTLGLNPPEARDHTES